MIGLSWDPNLHCLVLGACLELASGWKRLEMQWFWTGLLLQAASSGNALLSQKVQESKSQCLRCSSKNMGLCRFSFRIVSFSVDFVCMIRERYQWYHPPIHSQTLSNNVSLRMPNRYTRIFDEGRQHFSDVGCSDATIAPDEIPESVLKIKFFWMSDSNASQSLWWALLVF